MPSRGSSSKMTAIMAASGDVIGQAYRAASVRSSLKSVFSILNTFQAVPPKAGRLERTSLGDGSQNHAGIGVRAATMALGPDARRRWKSPPDLVRLAS